MGLATKFAALLVLLLNVSSISAIQSLDDQKHCESTVKKWASSSLNVEVSEDKHTLKDLLFFLHIPRTGGRSYFFCFLRKLYASSLECPRSYDKLRLDPSKPKCRLLVTHDDYSMMSKVHKDETSVVTILRNPIDRVFSTYEFSIEVAARFLVHPNLTSAMRMSVRLRSKRGVVSTLDIWPWKYLVPWMREDLFARREIRRLEDPTYETHDPYDMGDIVMPLHEYINDPIARDIIHNGATFQIAGLTNNSYAPEAHEIRHCVLKHHTLGEYVLRVAKKRLDDMLYVGLTEDHKESATMFANVVGSQVISQSIPSSNNTGAEVVEDTSDESSSSLVSESETNIHQNGSRNQKLNKAPSENVKSTSKNMTVGKLMKDYETCIKGLRSSQATRRVSSFRNISPANFTKETRNHVPEMVLQQIRSLNSLDMELYAYAKDIYLKKHQHVMQKLYVDKMRETQKSISGDVYGIPSRNILWSIVSIVSFLLVIVLFVKARRRTSKLNTSMIYI